MHPRNNFNAIRLVAALLVVLGHMYGLTGQKDPVPLGVPASHLGVCIFFALSGYLITDSWQRQSDVSIFFIKRALRIFPALIGVVVFSITILGPLLTSLKFHEYFASHEVIGYLKNIALYITYSLPGVFTNNPLPAVNGSLWSLPVEFACYLTVPAFASIIPCATLRAGALALIGIIGGGLWVYKWAYGLNLNYVFYATEWISGFGLIVYFFLGAALRLMKGRIPLRVDLAIAGLGISAAIYALTTKFYPPVHWFTLTYAVIAIGSASFPVMRDAARYGDLSYGIYLYSFPLQQAVIHYWRGPQETLQMFAISTALSMALAFLSWHAIEKQALRLKPQSVRFDQTGQDHARSQTLPKTQLSEP